MSILEETPPEISALIERGEKQGELSTADVDAVTRSLELTGDQVAELYDRIEESGIGIEREEDERPARPVRYTLENLNTQTTDALQMFLNEAGRYPLLTPPRRSTWPSASSAATSQAKELLINSNLRLVVSNARRYQSVRGCACSTSSRRACSA